MDSFFLYRHLRTDISPPIPFYIGIGSKTNSYNSVKSEYKRAYIIHDRNQCWKTIFNQCNKQIEIEILFESESKKEITRKEKEFIKLYGRIDIGTGILSNKTDGGTGFGSVHTYETKRKIGMKSIGNKNKLGMKWLPEQYIKMKNRKFTEAQKRHWATQRHSEETKRKIGLAGMGRIPWNKGVPMREKSKIKLSQSHTGKKQSQETVEKRRKSMLGHLVSIETRKKIGDSHKGLVHTEESKRKMSESRKSAWKIQKGNGYTVSQETRDKLRKLQTGRKASDETKQKLSLSHLGKKRSAESIKKAVISRALFFKNKQISKTPQV